MTRAVSSDDIWIRANAAQQGIWVLDRDDDLRVTYMVPAVIRIQGPVDVDRLVDAVGLVLSRHPALRARFRLDPVHHVVQFRVDGSAPEVGLLDAQAQGWTPEDLQRLVRLLCYTAFDLAHDAPARAQVITVEPGTTLLVLTAHHIVCDGWSRVVLNNEIAAAYRALARGESPELPPASMAFVSAEVPDPVDLAERAGQVADRLRGAPLDVELPFARSAGPTPLVAGTVDHRLDADLSAGLLGVAEAEGCTAFMLTIALLAATLARGGEQRSFVFAFGWPGRDDPDRADAIGMFMNTLMVRVDIDDDMTWTGLLRASRLAAFDAFMDGDVPLDAVVSELKPVRERMWPPLSPVLVNMFEAPELLDLGPGVSGRYTTLDPLYVKYDLAMFARVATDGPRPQLALSVDHPADVFDADDVSTLLTDLERTARALVANPEDPVLEKTQNDLTDPDVRLELVLQTWQEILGLDDVDEDSSFFDAGGNSMLLIVLVEKLSTLSGRNLKTMDLFRAGTARAQADLLVADGAPTAAGAASSSLQDIVAAARGEQR